MLPKNFSWLTEAKLAGSARPESEAEMKGLKDASEGYRVIDWNPAPP
jgi:hypothetical protein